MLVLVLFLLCIGSFVKGDLTLGLKANPALCIEMERQALLFFKASIVNMLNSIDDWSNIEIKRDCCKWSCVNCNNNAGPVTELS